MTTTNPTPVESDGLNRVPLSLTPLNRKDFTSGQEVRWCPGCGDYAILAAFQGFLPELGIKRENTVLISGIGCAARLPYYVNAYGMHSIHGRAPAIATGVATAREDLAVWVITGDGDALSIGGNHLIHALRRNVNLTILMFNNQIYGLTKGQYSPTSERGKITKSSPYGSVDSPFNPLSVAIGAEASFVARTIDSDRAHLTEVLKAATAHRGASFVEIYQNCPIFNDGAFAAVKGANATDAIIPLVHGQQIRFGADDRFGVARNDDSGLEVVKADQVDADRLITHNAHHSDPTYAFALSRLTNSGTLRQTPIGIFRDIQRPAYDDSVREQIEFAKDGTEPTLDTLQDLINGRDTWHVD